MGHLYVTLSVALLGPSNAHLRVETAVDSAPKLSSVYGQNIYLYIQDGLQGK